VPEGNCSVDYRGHSNRGDRERKRTEPQVYSIQTQPDEIHSSTRSEKHTKASTSLARGRAGTPGTKQAGREARCTTAQGRGANCGATKFQPSSCLPLLRKFSGCAKFRGCVRRLVTSGGGHAGTWTSQASSASQSISLKRRCARTSLVFRPPRRRLTSRSIVALMKDAIAGLKLAGILSGLDCMLRYREARSWE